MTLEEIQQKKSILEKQIQQIPLLQQQYHRLCGMEEILLEQQKESEKPELKVANK
tara:strand:- start:3476 stop:3640 length:165 start_codon:yes stop_codon:yes gene_type:complete